MAFLFYMEYYKDYYLNNKFIGSTISHLDRETFGFMGRKKEIFTDSFKLDNGKIIKPSTEYITELQLLCGRK